MPHRLVVSLYGATEAAYDGLTQRRGSYKAFRRGIAAAIGGGLPVRLNIAVTDVSADETTVMAGLAEDAALTGRSGRASSPIVPAGCWER
jgi:MoaA/NifB/PqqE/SkfB family radical SAM enzyme